ncbi:MAG: MFS transporter [Alphaproteobacteria bacterium]
MQFLIVMCLVGFANSIAWRAVDPMLPVMATEFSVTLPEAALLATSYSFAFAIMQLVFGPMGDAFGKVRLIRISLFMVAASQVWMAVSPSFASLILARGWGGAFAGGVMPIALALVGDRIAMAERQVALGRFMVAAISGQLIGAAAAGLLVDLIGWRMVFVSAAAVIFMSCVATLVFLHETQIVRKAPSAAGSLAVYRSVLTNRTALMVIGVLVCEGIFVHGVIPFVGGLVQDHGAENSYAAGLVIAGFATGGILYGLIVRSLLKTFGRWTMVRIGGVTCGVALALSALPSHWVVLAVLFLFAGLGFYMLHGTIQALATELAPENRGTAMAAAAFFFSLGQAVGPVVSGLLVNYGSYAVLYTVMGAATLALGFAAALLRHRVGH